MQVKSSVLTQLEEGLKRTQENSLEDLLGTVCYVANNAETNSPNTGILPGVLTALETTLEGHATISQTCEDPNTHDHRGICSIIVDKNNIRSGGHLISEQDLKSCRLVLKYDGEHELAKPLMLTSRGLALIDLSDKVGIRLAVWGFPTLALPNLVTGTVAYVDRSILFGERVTALAGKESVGTLFGTFRERRGRVNDLSIQGFYCERDWVYQDVEGGWISCDRVVHNCEYGSVSRIEESLKRV